MNVLVQLTSTSEKTSLPRFRCLTVLVQLLVDLSPARKTAEIAVVDKEVCMDFSADIGWVGSFFWVRAVDRVRRDPLIFHELNGVLKFRPVAVRPKYDTMTVVLKHLNSFYSKWFGLAYLWVSVFNNSTVEIYCYEQALTHYPLL